jgi:hypothetical protein
MYFSKHAAASPLEMYVRRWRGWAKAGVCIDGPNQVNAIPISSISPAKIT